MSSNVGYDLIDQVGHPHSDALHLIERSGAWIRYPRGYCDVRRPEGITRNHLQGRDVQTEFLTYGSNALLAFRKCKVLTTR